LDVDAVIAKYLYYSIVISLLQPRNNMAKIKQMQKPQNFFMI